ncbi:hypothetical protein K4F52_003679 [Lecanicillium sp. MT-2017a]|nr:hypothetical protein K4F52_003679 [Lecanicillium sp. MT-2017a]
MKTAVVVSTCLLGAFAAPAANIAQRDVQQEAGLLKPISDIAGGVPVLGPLIAGILGTLDKATEKLPTGGLTKGLGNTVGGVVSGAGDAVKGVPGVGGAVGGVTDAVGDAVKGATGGKRALTDEQMFMNKLVDMGYDQKYAEGITDALSALLQGVPGLGPLLAGLTKSVSGTVKGVAGSVPVVGGVANGIL